MYIHIDLWPVEYVKKGKKYLSPFHHSLDTIQLVPLNVKQMKIIERTKYYQSLDPNPSNKGSYLRQSVCTRA